MAENYKKRKSVRLKKFDYSSNGAYFITIIVENRKELLGRIIDSTVMYTDMGEIAYKNWLEIPKHYENIILDQFVIMPNHVHGILLIENVKAQYIVPLRKKINEFQHVIPKSIGSAIRSYKASVTREISISRFKWQRGFYDRVIRNEDELKRCREYIINNPLKWDLDRNNPESKNYEFKSTIY